MHGLRRRQSGDDDDDDMGQGKRFVHKPIMIKVPAC